MNLDLTLWTKKVLITLGIALLCFMIYSLRDIFFILIVSGFLTIIINPLVNLGEKYKIPVWITLIGVLIIVSLLGSIVIGTLIPIVIDYISDTVGAITTWTNNAQQTYLTQGIKGFQLHPFIERMILFLFRGGNLDHTLDIIRQNAGNIQSFLTTQVSSLTSGGIAVVSQVGGAIGEWLIIVISTFLMVLERKAIGKYILSLIPSHAHSYFEDHYTQIQHVFTSWMKATLILSVSIFATTYIGLKLVEGIFGFDTERAFTLALIGGIMEFIPYVGPLIALIPAAIIGLGISWKAAGIIVILYLIIQRIENDFLVPYVMSKALDLSPFLVFIVMLAGASLGGILGIILAIPLAGVMRIILDGYRKTRENVPKKLTTLKKTISSKTVSK